MCVWSDFCTENCHNYKLHCLIAIGSLYIPQYTVHCTVKVTLRWLCTVEYPLDFVDPRDQWRGITERNRRTNVSRLPVITDVPKNCHGLGSETSWLHSQTQSFNLTDSIPFCCNLCQTDICKYIVNSRLTLVKLEQRCVSCVQLLLVVGRTGL
jgi:hypothetical protein